MHSATMIKDAPLMDRRGYGAIDFRHLDHCTAGDGEVKRDVLDIFRKQAAAWVCELAPEMPDETWHHLAHSLKGSARGIGAFEFARIAETAEMLTGEHTNGQRRALLDHLNDELIRVLTEIDRALH